LSGYREKLRFFYPCYYFAGDDAPPVPRLTYFCQIAAYSDPKRLGEPAADAKRCETIRRCEFRRNPATDSDLMPAAVPI